MKAEIYIGYAVIPEALELNTALLTDNQRTYFESEICFSSNKRKQQFYASRRLLKQLCDSYFAAEKLSYQEPASYPYQLVNIFQKGHAFSISHSEDVVCVALSTSIIERDIGVDIQQVKGNWTPEKARFFCNEDQINQGLSSKQPDHFFSQQWSKYEAYFKAQQRRSSSDHDMFSTRVLTQQENCFFVSLFCNSEHQVQLQQWAFKDDGQLHFI